MPDGDYILTEAGFQKYFLTTSLMGSSGDRGL
jgi:hypothetical protein